MIDDIIHEDEREHLAQSNRKNSGLTSKRHSMNLEANRVDNEDRFFNEDIF